MASRASNWAQVLDSTDAATRQMMLQLQFEDLAIAEDDVAAHTTEGLQTDQAIAHSLFHDELKQYQKARGIELPPITKPPPRPRTPPPPPPIPHFTCVSCEDTFTVAPNQNAESLQPVPRLSLFARLSHRLRGSALGPNLAPGVPSAGEFDSNHCYPVPCGHYYCNGCLNQLFGLSMEDRTLYPPRCCTQPIPLEDVRFFLDAQLLATFEAKKPELDDAQPLYCHVPTCSAYIGGDDRDDTKNEAQCQKCEAKTCLSCKMAAHNGDCKDNEDTKKTMDLAKEKGWQNCPECKMLIELELGCNHMTCRCKTDFCYVCGVVWKNCPCPQFDENRLLRRGQQIAARDGDNLPAVMQNLRARHECIEHDWEWRRGSGNCDTCLEDMPVFIFRCRLCATRTCRRCLHNRS